MVFLKEIKVLKNSYPSNVLKIGTTILCKDVNIFVGDQGVGKSALLNMLLNKHDDLQMELSQTVVKEGVDVFYFDTEKDNPRIKDPQLYTNAYGKDKGIGYKNAMMSRFVSHGELLKSFVIQPLLKVHNSVILLDEPESGLSIKNQYELIKAISIAVQNGCQIFIATHSAILINAFDVYSLDHYELQSGRYYLQEVEQNYFDL